MKLGRSEPQSSALRQSRQKLNIIASIKCWMEVLSCAGFSEVKQQTRAVYLFYDFNQDGEENGTITVKFKGPYVSKHSKVHDLHP